MCESVGEGEKVERESELRLSEEKQPAVSAHQLQHRDGCVCVCVCVSVFVCE